jgi:5-methylcytosine-specific restriction endonuclease McrA
VSEQASEQSVPPTIRRLIADGNPIYLRITSPISLAAENSSQSLTLMAAVNLVTGESWRVVADTVLASELRIHYPTDGYVGKCFEIRKFKPEHGKRYATFAIAEIEPSNETSAEQLASVFAELSADLQRERENPIEYRRSLAAQNPLAVPYDEYRRTPLWRKIKRRVLKRDDNRCRRCGGGAAIVHHRSYEEEVMLGNNDEQLASICEGCHNIIHFDDSGKGRSAEETDRMLLTRDENTSFPTPKVDMRRTMRIALPPEWPRMTAVQRGAWNNEYQRLKIIRWGQSGKSPSIIRNMLRRYGMTDAEIDTAISLGKQKRRSKR